jgi:hypothetical protein
VFPFHAEDSATTLRDLAAALAARGVPAPAGGHAWRPEQVRRVLASAAAAAPREGAAT